MTVPAAPDDPSDNDADTDAQPTPPPDDDRTRPDDAMPAAFPLVGDVIEAVAEHSPHPVQRLADAGPHEIETPHELGLVARFDAAVDQAFDHLRGHTVADRIFYAATELGDFGLIWVLIGLGRGVASEHDLAAAARLTATLGAESVLVNGIVKQFFKRERPVFQGPRPYKMRIPLTTSFPSGHSSTAVVAAMLLSEARPKAAPLYWGVAGLVAASRVHVRIHHASDVVGGVATGLVIGTAARAFWRRMARR